MRLSLQARLKKLSVSCAPGRPPPEFRCGFLKTLPPEFEGERHIVTLASPAGARTTTMSLKQFQRRVLILECSAQPGEYPQE